PRATEQAWLPARPTDAGRATRLRGRPGRRELPAAVAATPAVVASAAPATRGDEPCTSPRLSAVTEHVWAPSASAAGSARRGAAEPPSSTSRVRAAAMTTGPSGVGLAAM